MKKLITALILVLPQAGFAQDADAEAGAMLYADHCAVCHGADADGKGPLAPALLLQPPNLRTLTTRHGGVFPMERVVTRIDGRDPLVAHGSPMPVYGEFFEGDDTAMKTASGQPMMMSGPVANLVAYLQGLQE